MVKFIDEIVDYYSENFHEQALKTCIITPNRRAHRFLKEAIVSRAQKGDFLPDIISIDDFIFKNIPWIRIDEVDLTYQLFHVFQAQNTQEEFDFNDFMTYATILLHDFNEIDMQMADGKAIFSYLNDAKAIQQWNPDGNPLSTSQKEYLRFYNQLANIYLEFRKQLIAKKICYQGMAYRYFAENLDSISELLPYENLLFAGFNALTESEEYIIKKLYQNKMAHTLWDADKYYVNDKMMEAGLYLRKYQTWNAEIEKQKAEHFRNPRKKIGIYGSPGVLGQARLTAKIIEEEIKKEAQEGRAREPSKSFENNTVIVPSDESLLLPLLNSISIPLLEHTNITMGFPIQHSHAYRLAESLVRMQIHTAKISNLDNIRFHKDNLLDVWNNELLKSINPNLQIDSASIHQIFIGQQALNVLIDELKLQAINDAFQSCDAQPTRLINQLISVYKILLKQENNNALTIAEKDALNQILQIFNRLKILITKHQEPKSLTSFYLLFKKLIQGLSQSFRGDIHQGIQLMGLLETRLMDFENVIILSVNEDILPTSAFSNSFIPTDIKYEFEMPGIQERTAVYAYHFYRLIQRAKNVYILYSTTKKKMSGGEKSRFIKQLEYELKNYNKKINIKHQLLNFKKSDIQKPQNIVVVKDQNTLNRLDKLAEYGLSPTAINTYIRCPLQFYYKYIASIKEPKQPEDFIDERIIGNVIHHILEDFYRPYIGKYFPYQALISFYKKIPELVITQFKKEFTGKLDEGANYLSTKDTGHYLRQFIQYEIKASKEDQSTLIILGVEEVLERKLQIHIDGETKEIRIKGNADRIDKKNGVVRVLDYKTGSVDKKHIKINKPKDADSLHPLFRSPDYDKALQLFVYRWMYQKHSSENIEAGIVSFRLIKSPYVMLEDEFNNPDKMEEAFRLLMSHIFDSKTPFTQTSEIKNCGYCIYKDICSR
jgi:CRISPR/Cas system-associated exonuclease Cas4 (RecB family)